MLSIQEVIVIKIELAIWLQIMPELTYIVYVRLIQCFQSTQQLYQISKDASSFYSFLKRHAISLPEVLCNQLLDSYYKEKSRSICEWLNRNQIHMVPIFSKEYPRNLLEMYNPPFIIIARGNLSLLFQHPILYIYENENFTTYGKKLVRTIKQHWDKEKGVLIVWGRQQEDVSFYETHRIISCNAIKSYEEILKIPMIYTLQIYVLQPVERVWELTAGMLDAILISEARYEKLSYALVMLVQELGKDILAVPGYIHHPNFYFSNYLIKEGAYVILNKYHLEDYIKS